MGNRPPELIDVWKSRLELREQACVLNTDGDEYMRKVHPLFLESLRLYAEADKVRGQAFKLKKIPGSREWVIADITVNDYKTLVESERLLAEGDIFFAKGNKASSACNEMKAQGYHLHSEADKLCAEGNILWAEAVFKKYGNIKMEWEGGSCHLENGEKYES